MPTEVEAPDGTVIEFPDGMSDDEISSVMAREYGGPSTDFTPVEQRELAPPVGYERNPEGGYSDYSPLGRIGADFMQPMQNAWQDVKENYSRPIEAGREFLRSPSLGSYGDFVKSLAGSAVTQPFDAANLLASPVSGAMQAVGGVASDYGPQGYRYDYGQRQSVPMTRDEVKQAYEGAISMGLGKAPLRAPAAIPRLPKPTNAEVKAGRILRRFTEDVPAPSEGMLPLEYAGGKAPRLARAVAANPTEGAEVIENAIRQRRATMPDRMISSVEQATGQSGAQMYPTLDALNAAKREAAAPLYQQAYQRTGVQSDALDQLMSRPSMQSALRRAESIAAEEGVNPQSLGFGGGGMNSPSARTWDYIKRGLDDVLEANRDPVTGRLILNEETRAVQETRAALRDALREQVPELGAAWDAYAGPQRQIEAMRRGRQMIRGRNDPENILMGNDRLSEDEIAAQNIGVARGITDMLRSGNPRNAVRQLSQNELLQDRVSASMGNPEAARSLFDAARREAGSEAIYQNVLGGSRTTPLAEDIASINRTAADEWGGMAGALAKRAQGRSFMSQGVDYLVNQGMNMLHPALRRDDVSKVLADALVGNRSIDDVVGAIQRQKHVSAADRAQAIESITNWGRGSLVAGGSASPLQVPAMLTNAVAEEEKTKQPPRKSGPPRKTGTR